MRTYGKGSARNNSMFEMFCVFFSSLCSCSLLLYSVCCCFCCANSIADVISCFIYSAVPHSRARSQSKTIFFSLSLLSCKIFTLYLCIWPKSYHLLDYFYSASRWKCINYMYDFSPFMHVFVLFLFLRICQSAEQNNTHTHTFIHVHTPLSEKLAGKISQHLFIKRENEA